MANNILFILILGILLSSCSVLKKTKKTSEFHNDTTALYQSNKATAVNKKTETTIVKDTVITVKGRTVIDTIDIAEIMPKYDSNGNVVRATKNIQGKNVSVQTTTLPNGKIVIEGNCAEYDMIVPGLISKVITKDQKIDSLEQKLQQSIKQQKNETTEATKRSLQLPWWVWVVGFTVLTLWILSVLNKIKLF